MPDIAEPSFFSAQISHARRFYLDLKPTPRGPLTVVSGGVEQCAPDYEINRRGFPFLSVEFVARGRGAVRIGGVEHPLTPGSLFTYGPRMAHRITTDPRNRMVKYFVDFTGAPGPRLLEEAGLPPGSFAQVCRPNEICAIFDDLIANGLQGARHSKPICAALATYLLLKMSETLLPGGTGKAGAFETYQRCRQHIADHYLTASSQEEIADACHVDTAYLCRLFQRFDHQTPYQMLMRLKMNHAADRLLHSGLLVKQVADELGFADAFHFSRTFKRVQGIAPHHFLNARVRS